MSSVDALPVEPSPDPEQIVGGWRYHLVSILLLLVDAQYKVLIFSLLVVVAFVRLGCLPVRALSQAFD